MSDKPSPIRPTDAEALQLARRLVRGSPFASLGVLDPKTGFPAVSRVLSATDMRGAPFTLVSSLSGHTQAMLEDERVSLLFGDVGKGDPLAHPRITLACRARRVVGDGGLRNALRVRFLRCHPKAALYADFADFSFFSLEPVSASLNGGFGRAYMLTGADLLVETQAADDLAAMEGSAIDHMNADHADAVDLYAKVYGKSRESGWQVCAIDPGGLTLAREGRWLWIEFDHPLQEADALRAQLTRMAQKSRRLD
jgi:heme iron utilization protein